MTSSALGSLLVVRLEDGPRAISLAMEARRRSPWCPIILVASEVRASAALLEAVVRLPASTMTVDSGALAPGHTRKAIEQVFRRLPPPDESAMCRYLVTRTARPDVAEALKTSLASPELGVLSRSTLSRVLSSYGPLTSRDWRAVGQVIQALHHGRGVSIDRLAWDSTLSPRTLRERSMHYLGVSVGEAAEMPGWEWKLEAVLRRFGYVAEASADPEPHRSGEPQAV